jgi:hypothetical protein
MPGTGTHLGEPAEERGKALMESRASEPDLQVCRQEEEAIGETTGLPDLITERQPAVAVVAAETEEEMGLMAVAVVAPGVATREPEAAAEEERTEGVRLEPEERRQVPLTVVAAVAVVPEPRQRREPGEQRAVTEERRAAVMLAARAVWSGPERSRVTEAEVVQRREVVAVAVEAALTDKLIWAESIWEAVEEAGQVVTQIRPIHRPVVPEGGSSW